MAALAGPPVPSSSANRPVVSITEMGSPSPDADASSSSDESVSGLELDDPDEIRPTTYALGLSKSYVPGWQPVDAFRDLYQNWKDAIVDSFDLDPRAFAPRWKTTPNQVQITVHRAVVSAGGRRHEELLGYIRLNKKAGILELANFRAKLEMRNLTFGGTTKYGRDRFAGVHGEGLKLAALVMHRNGHAIRVSSTSYYWNFGFRGTYQDRFYCRLTPAKPETIQRKKELLARRADHGPRRALVSHIWEDVTVRISKGRGADGVGITEQDLRSWVTVAIDLCRPSADGLIRTDHGDLILDEEFSGRIYLKGLRIADHSSDGKKHVFGHNFARGRINRDRERLASAKEEAVLLAEIWAQPILEGREDMVRRYIALFRNYEDSLDIALAEEVVSAAVAETICNVLSKDSPDSFFYCDKADGEGADGADPLSIIVTYLKRRAEKVPRILWRILRKFSLVRTPQEERLHLFMSSQPANMTDSPFGASVLRMLQAALKLDQRLGQITIRIVEGGETGIDLVYKEDEKSLLISEKWLDFDKIHQETPCELSLLAAEDPAKVNEFVCDHVVEDLLELVIEDVRRQLKLDAVEATTIRRVARGRIRQTPRWIRTFKGLRAGELEVRWTSNESGIVAESYGRNILYDATLHRWSSCKQKSQELLHQVDEAGNAQASCGCPSQVASQSSCTAIFKGLDCNEEYFPMVARRGSGTFFGTTPTAIAPQGIDCGDNAAASRAVSLSQPRTTPQPPRRGRELQTTLSAEFVDLTDARDSDDSEPMSDDDQRMMDYDEPVSDVQADNTYHNGILEPSYSRGGDPSPQVDGANGISDWQKDEEAWLVWHREELPLIASRVFGSSPRKPAFKMCEERGGWTDTGLVCERLGCRFEKDTYIRLRENSDHLPDYVALIHEVHSGANGCDVKSAHLIATKYSVFEPDVLIGTRNSWVEEGAPPSQSDSKEVLLHFSAVEVMGLRWDGEVIDVDDILEAELLPPDFEIIHCTQAPPDYADSSNLFCRFACATSSQSLVLMPLAPELLPRKRRQKLIGFVNPSAAFVVDLTPNVLGPLEGFTKCGHHALAGIGFDEERHVTWRLRNPACKVYDGSPQGIFDDFASGKLLSPDSAPPGHPKIALVAGENSNFRLSDGNKGMRSVESFLTPLDIMDSATTSPLNPDFTVLLMPPALLHSSTVGRLSRSVVRLLEQGQSVRIGLQSLEETGAPQSRSLLVVIGTPYPGLSGASEETGPATTDSSAPQPMQRVSNFIQDLSCENPRASRCTRGGFTCSLGPVQGVEAGASMKHIYNHQTGQHVPAEREAIVPMDANTVALSCSSSWSLVHPDRRDLLTVRELARIQGFEDDFVFYGSLRSQYYDVLAAQAPSIAQLVAEIVSTVAKLSQKTEIRNVGENARGCKRARVENGD